MKRWKKIALISASTLTVLIGGSLWFVLSAFPDMCGNELLAEYPSPDNKYRAVVFERDCGATTGFSTQVSILKAGFPLRNEAGNLFSADTDHGKAPDGPGGGPAVHVSWVDVRTIKLTHHARARIFFSRPQVAEITVSYATID
ncbi:MAG: hypothetical protein EPO06_03170 [Burkholderiaceae bacterium]|nr:MAG: hypothetical protein EPO06_03170 [Burkholderiaceae bacterium]